MAIDCCACGPGFSTRVRLVVIRVFLQQWVAFDAFAHSIPGIEKALIMTLVGCQQKPAAIGGVSDATRYVTGAAKWHLGFDVAGKECGQGNRRIDSCVGFWCGVFVTDAVLLDTAAITVFRGGLSSAVVSATGSQCKAATEHQGIIIGRKRLLHDGASCVNFQRLLSVDSFLFLSRHTARKLTSRKECPFQ